MKRSVSIIILVVLLMTAIAPAFAEHTHRWMTEGYQAATCSRDGYSRRRCITCGATDYTRIYSKGHQYTEWEVITKPTYYLEGLRKHHCKKCRQEVSLTIPCLKITNNAKSKALALFGKDKQYNDADAPGEKCIENIQKYLNMWGYKIKVDGIFGEKTRNAVMGFQLQHKIPKTGIVGEQTALELSCK